MSGDAPSAVVMIRPTNFRVNPETASDNSFQTDELTNAKAAYDEVTAAADLLQSKGVTVHLFDDEGSETPDSVFPNNWFSTHEDGRISLYPMRAPSRRGERRQDVIDFLRAEYLVSKIVDYSSSEDQGRFLEGTGSLVLDRTRKLAFAALSPRTHPNLVTRFCDDFDYRPIMFTATDTTGTPVYHTNVIMAVGTGYAIAALDMIRDKKERAAVAEALAPLKIIDISEAQVAEFAGNAFELRASDGLLLSMSERAANALTTEQRTMIKRHAEILPIPVPTIEASGGSVRCMLAGIHLPDRD